MKNFDLNALAEDECRELVERWFQNHHQLTGINIKELLLEFGQTCWLAGYSRCDDEPL